MPAAGRACMSTSIYCVRTFSMGKNLGTFIDELKPTNSHCFESAT